MENKYSEEKLLKLIRQVNTALNSMGQKLANKINEITKDISDIKQELDNETMRNIDGIEKIEGRLLNLEERNNLNEKETLYEEVQINKIQDTNVLETEITKIQEMIEQNKLKVCELDVKIKSLLDNHHEHEQIADDAFNDGRFDVEVTKSFEKTDNCEINNQISKYDECASKRQWCDKKESQIEFIPDRRYICNICGVTFVNRYNMETHMISKHDKLKSFNCEMCNVEFVSEWRFKKHIAVHDDKSRRKCHYFNNGGDCPFFKDGCKFLHENARLCDYRENCKRTKCQYRH